MTDTSVEVLRGPLILVLSKIVIGTIMNLKKCCVGTAANSCSILILSEYVKFGDTSCIVCSSHMDALLYLGTIVLPFNRAIRYSNQIARDRFWWFWFTVIDLSGSFQIRY